MIFKQFYLSCLAHASYVIGDRGTGTAAVVDPQRDTDQYLAFVAEHALQIKHVFLTHLHADSLRGIWSCAIAWALSYISAARPKHHTHLLLLAMATLSNSDAFD